MEPRGSVRDWQMRPLPVREWRLFTTPAASGIRIAIRRQVFRIPVIERAEHTQTEKWRGLGPYVLVKSVKSGGIVIGFVRN